jgi:minor extracellular serine protease Vpr
MFFLDVRRVFLYTLVAVFFLPAFAQQYSDQYALILDDTPVVARFAGRDTQRSAAADAYRRQLVSAQQAVRSQATARKVMVTGAADTVLNAVFVHAQPDQVADLKAIPGVKAVIRMRTATPFMNRAATVVNAPAAWTSLGGQSSAGTGIKIGIIDSGIDQTHPVFQDSSLQKPAGFPKCTDGYPEDCNYTTNKVIVARSYVRQIAPGSNPSNPAADSRPDDFSPRDRDGHGTAVASAAAANPTAAVSAALGGGTVMVTGIAPKAFLGSYKVTGSPGVNDNPPESVLIQAVNDAVKDGMDVVNISMGFPALYGPQDTGATCGQPAGTPCDPLATAYENAVKAGVVVIAATGNYGSDGLEYPTFNTITSPGNAPDVISVGASTNSHYFDQSVSIAGGSANLQNLVSTFGDNYTNTPLGGAVAPLVDVSTLGNDGLACTALPGGSLNGTFAFVKRGTCQFSVKEANVLNAGAQGLIIYNSDSSGLFTPTGLTGSEPVAVISLADGTNVKNFLASNPGAMTTIDPSGTEVDDAADQDEVAYFSSYGPALDGTLKPDLVAPGSSATSYNGLYMATQNFDPNSFLFSTTRYIGAAGTSFSAPIVAGAAALVKQKHPTWTPAQIKSALVNSASQAVKTNDQAVSGSADPIDAQWIGAGRLDVGAAVNSTVLAVPSSISFGILTAAPSGLSKTITLTNTSAAAVTLAVATAAGAKSLTGNLAAGITPALDKTSLTLAPGASGTVAVSLSGALPAAGSYSGAITFTASGVSLRVPYLYLIGSGTPHNVWTLPANIAGVVGQPVNNDLSMAKPGPNPTIAVMVTDAAGIPVPNAAVAWSSTPRRAITFANSSATTNSYGIAITDVTIAQTGFFTINVIAGGLSTSFDYTFNCNCFGRVQPTISNGGVVSAANAGPITPGSLASIYGTGLSDPGYTDSASYVPLPLVLDGVTVSFDVPSAKISVPARLVSVSPNQVNVQVPWELQGQTSAQVKVTIDSYSFGNVVTVPVADASPEFYVSLPDTGIIAARDTSFNQIMASHPAVRGQGVSLYLNNLGPVTNQPATGEVAGASPLAMTKETPVVMIGGQNAPVQFSGLAPGFPSLYQVNVTVPSNISAGNQPITISIGGKTSPAKVAGANGATIVIPVQ